MIVICHHCFIFSSSAFVFTRVTKRDVTVCISTMSFIFTIGILLYRAFDIILDTSVATSDDFTSSHVGFLSVQGVLIGKLPPVLKYDGHDVWVAVECDAVNRQRWQQRKVARSARRVTHALVRLVVAIVATR